MREIKFRLWTGSEMIYDPIVWTPDCQLIGGTKLNQAIKAAQDEEDFILMQFTGLKDKNGKPIFEGDVVSWGGSNYGFGCVVYEGYSFVVKYKLGEVEDTMYFNHPDAYTIIGNIYENPDLLKP